MAEMTKAERKAAIKAAKKAEKEEKKAAIAAGGNNKSTSTTEKKEEVKKEPQVTAQTATTKKEEPKKEETKKDSKPVSTQKEKQKKDPKVPEFIPEVVEETDKPKGKKSALDRAAALVSGAAGIPVGSTTSSLDGKAMLAFVMWDKYGKNDELQKHYPELYNDLMRSIDVVTLLGLVDARQDLLNRNERGELNIIVDVDQVLPLQNMANLLGINLAPAKALPGSDGSQLSIDFAKSEVPEELSKDAGKAVDKIPELDPNKITTDEELIAALNYLISKGKNVAVNIVNTVEWYRTYCGLKETNADKKLALEARSIEDWIKEVFSKINPVSLIRGLGQSVYIYTSQTGSPCMGHAVLHNHMINAGWSEEEVASALKALITENFRYKQQKDENYKNMNPADDKALRGVISSLGNDYIDKLFADYSAVTKDMPDGSEKTELEARQRVARMVIGSVRTNYFNKDYSPSSDELRMKVGQIINLYRDPADRLAEYCQDHTIFPKEGEYPERKKDEPTDEKKN